MKRGKDGLIQIYSKVNEVCVQETIRMLHIKK